MIQQGDHRQTRQVQSLLDLGGGSKAAVLQLPCKSEGCTQRYTNLALEELINTTLRDAVAAAAEEDLAIDESLDIDAEPIDSV